MAKIETIKDKIEVVIDKNNKTDQLIMKILQNSDKKQLQEIDSILRIYTLTGGSSVKDNMFLTIDDLPAAYIPDGHIKYLNLSSYIDYAREIAKDLKISFETSNQTQASGVQKQIIDEIKDLLKTFPVEDLKKIHVNNQCTEQCKSIREVLTATKDKTYSVVTQDGFLKQKSFDYISGLDAKELQLLRYVFDVYCNDNQKDTRLYDNIAKMLIQHPEAAKYININPIIKLNLDVELRFGRITKEKYDSIFEYAKSHDNPIFEYLQKIPPYYTGSILDEKKETHDNLQAPYSDQIIETRKDIKEFMAFVNKKLDENDKTL